MRKFITTIAVLSAAVALLAVSSAQAITKSDAESRAKNYIRGRCGISIGPFVLYRCLSLIFESCVLKGNQPGHVQWYCIGHTFEQRVLAVIGPRYRACGISVEYAPSGKRLHGDKVCLGYTPSYRLHVRLRRLQA